MKSAAEGKARLNHIDLLKCLAIYLVLAFHGTLYNNLVYAGMPLTELLRYFFRAVLSTCVPLFFTVNGYLLLSRPMDLKKHTRKTLKMMLLTCFWMFFLLLVLQPYYQDYYSWESFWDTCWELRDGWNNQLWYLEILIGIYLIFPLLKTAFDRDRTSFYWFAVVAAVLAFGGRTIDLGVTVLRLLMRNEYAMYYNEFPLFSTFNPLSSSMGLAYFCIGGVIWSVEGRLRQIPAKWRNLAAVTGLVLCCCIFGIMGWRFSLYRKKVWDLVWNGYNTVFTLGSVLCLYVLSLNWQREAKLVRQISSNTLGIYLIHDLLHKLFTPYVTAFAPMRSLPGTLVYAAALLLVSLGVCLVLRKIPLVKHLIT